MQVLPKIPNSIIKKIDTLIEQFLWNNKKAKIPLETLKCSSCNGGLRLVDLNVKDKALKISWIKRLCEDDSIANLAYQSLVPDLGQWIFDCNLNIRDIEHLKLSNPFWEDMLTAWCEMNYTTETSDQPIWYNSNIRINEKPIFNKKAFDKGLFRISQLFDQNQGRWISAKQASTDFELTVMEYNSTIVAIPKDIKTALVNKRLSTHQSRFANFVDRKDLSNYLYSSLIDQKDNTKLVKVKNKWELKLDQKLSAEKFTQHIIAMHKFTNITKFRSFHYRFMYRAIVTNI